MEHFTNTAFPTTVVSEDPKYFASHFIRLTKPNKKGQTRYRCVMCQHEFTCSGRKRRIQHILGKDYCIGKERNVSPCENPFLPLKENLLKMYDQESSESAGKTDDESSTDSCDIYDSDFIAYLLDALQPEEMDSPLLIEEASCSKKRKFELYTFHAPLEENFEKVRSLDSAAVPLLSSLNPVYNPSVSILNSTLPNSYQTSQEPDVKFFSSPFTSFYFNSNSQSSDSAAQFPEINLSSDFQSSSYDSYDCRFL
jgi:hypothetical protein